MEQIMLWTVIALVALAVDVATTSFVFSGFTVGGIFALIVQMMGANFYAQFIVFTLVSAAAVWVEVRWVRKMLKKTVPKTLLMEEEYIGRILTADDDIAERSRIKLEGIYWTIQNEGEPIKKGETFSIIGIKGNKLIIKK